MNVAGLRVFREGRLAVRLFVVTGAVLIATAIAAGYIGARQQFHARLAEIDGHAGRLAELVATLGADAVDRRSPGPLETIAAEVARDPRVRMIEIRDPVGNVVVASGPGAPRGVVAVATRDVRARGEVVGAVSVALSTDAARSAAMAEWRRVALAAALGLLGLAAAVPWFVRRAIAAPLASIGSAMAEVAETGSVTHRIEPRHLDEIGALARQFNQMAGRLAASHEDLARRVADTAAKNAELDSFVYSVAHDLKAPLLTIRGFCELLREHAGPQLDAADLRCLDRLDANVERLERLIFDLLTFARIGRDKPSPERVDLSEMIDDLQLDMRGLIRARGIKVTLQNVGTLWGPRSQIEQVFRNLLSNAIKYAGDTPQPTVEIGMESRDEMWACYVRDNGIGIDPAYHEKIFEIFQRLKDVEVEGTGVGLAIVKKVVEQAGGRIWVDSAPGQGSTFYFTWPKGEPADPAATPVPVAV